MIVAQVRVAWQIQSRATLCSVRQLINSKAHGVTIEAAARQAPRKLARALTSWNRTRGVPVDIALRAAWHQLQARIAAFWL